MRVTVTIKVDYDESSVPKNLCDDLKRNVDTAIQHGLLCDTYSEAIVDDFQVEVESD